MLVTQSTPRLTLSDLNGFIQSARSEDTTLEFKQKLYGVSDDDKKEFIKDVSAMANSIGGHIVIGIVEDEGCASTFDPISNVDLDAEILRLQSLCENCIEPNLVGLDMHHVDVPGGRILVVKVPRSLTAPHRANSKKSKLFYQRNSRSVSPMDVNQLRQAFVQTETALERAQKLSGQWAHEVRRKLTEQRRDAVELAIRRKSSAEEQDDLHENGPNDGVMLLHFISIGNLNNNTSLSIDALEVAPQHFRPFLTDGNKDRAFNLDGLKYFATGVDADLYTQLHRNGSVEMVFEKLLWQEDGKRELLGNRIVEAIKDSLSRIFKGFQKLDAQPPFFVKLQFLQVKNSTLDTGSPHNFWRQGRGVVTQSDLILNGVLLSDYPNEEKMEKLYRNLVDPLWNAYGSRGCPIPFHDD